MRNKIVPLLAALLVATAASFGQTISPIVVSPNQAGFLAFVGDPFSQTFSCTCGPGAVAWRIDAGSLPTGISLAAATGELSGSATAAQGVQFTISAVQVGTVRASRQYTFATAVHQITWTTPPTLPAATSGAPASRTLQVNLPSLWSQGPSTLPPGVSVALPPNGGPSATLTGTFPVVTTPATYTFQLTASIFSSPTGAVVAVIPFRESIQRTFSITVYPPPSVSAKFPAGEVGVAYNRSLTATGGAPPLRYFTVPGEGNLPPGLTLDPATGAVTGTPTNAGTYTFVIGATDANQTTDSSTSSVTIVPAPAVTTTAIASGKVGVSYSAALAVTGGAPPYTWSIAQGGLPAGLTLGASNGSITGTPTTAGAGRFTARVADANGAAATATLAITVAPPALAVSGAPSTSATAGSAYSGTFTASGGNPPYAWAVASGQLPPGISLSGGGVLSGVPAPSAGAQTYAFTVLVTDTAGIESTAATATRQFSLTVAAPALTITTATLPAATAGVSYTAALVAVGGTPRYQWTLNGGQLPAGLVLSIEGGISGTPSGPPGAYAFQVLLTDSNGVTAGTSLSILLRPQTVSIVTSSLPGGGVGAPYNLTLQATRGTPPYQWTVSGGALPAGVTLQPSGTLQGTPTTAGTANFSLSVLDAENQSDSKPFSITISLVRLTGTLPDGVVAAAYSGAISASGGIPPYTLAVTSGTLPAGLVLAGNSGAVSGTPTAAGVFTFVITATDSQRVTGSQRYSVTITTLTLDGVLPAGVPGTPYAGSVAASGGAPPYAYAVTSGALPAGLTLNAANGAIAGTPAAAAASTFTITVTDARKLTATNSFTITFKTGLVLSDSLPNGAVSSSYSAVVVSGGAPPYALTVAGGDWPDGLTADATGAIGGTPRRAGVFRFTLKASDTSQPPLSVARDYTITIGLPPLPGVIITKLSETAAPGSQSSFGVSLGQEFPVDLTGTATISFQPLSGPVDPDVKFANNQQTLSFATAAGQVDAVANPAPMAFSAGTTAGTITITVAISAYGQVLAPNPALTKTIVVPPAAPSISSVRIVNTSTGINILVTGYSNTREISGVTVTFTASNATFPGAQFDIPADAFRLWYANADSANFGGQFLLTAPFTLTQGAASLLTSVAVSLTNSVGRTTMSGGF